MGQSYLKQEIIGAVGVGGAVVIGSLVWDTASIGRAQAAPVAPDLSIVVAPQEFSPGEAGYVYIGGKFPLDVSVALDEQPIDIFWTGNGYIGVFAFGFDALPGNHLVHVEVVDQSTGDAYLDAISLEVTEYEYPLEQVIIPFRLWPLLDAQLNQAELDRLNEIYAGRSQPAHWDWPYLSPVPSGVVTSRFGGNRVYNGGMLTARHTGVDFRRAVGEPVFATAAGIVVLAEFLDVRGNVVIVDHGYGVFSQYAHLQQALVVVGEHVQQGQIIGLAGATGRANGPHLHFEIIVNGVTVNPLWWLSLAPGYVPFPEATPQPVDG